MILSQLISSHASFSSKAYPGIFDSHTQRKSNCRVANFSLLSCQTLTLTLSLMPYGPSNPGSIAHAFSRMTYHSTKDSHSSPLLLITDLTTPASSIPFSTTVNLDPDQCLAKDIRDQFQLLNFHFDNVFDTAIAEYIVLVLRSRPSSILVLTTWFFQSPHKNTTVPHRYHGRTSSQVRGK